MVANAYSTLAAWRQCNPEMEFLDINLTKVSSLLIHVIHSLSTGGLIKRIRLYSGLKNTYKKSAKQENLSLFTNIILYKGKMRVENQKKTWVWEGSSLCPETLTKNAVQEFHLCWSDQWRDQWEWIGLWKVAINRHLVRIVVIDVHFYFYLAAILE